MKIKRLLGLVLAMLIAGAAFAGNVALNPQHPDRYVVVKGDTLWDISARFLKDPWLWPEVWYVNPEIKNPHLIYPGDVITLSYVNGKPRLSVQRGRPTIVLSPTAQPEPLEQAIPTIPIDAIKQFLSRPLVVTKAEEQKSPYIVESADEHLIAGAGDRVYVRGIKGEEHARWVIFRSGPPYVDPETHEILGYEATYIGDARVQRFGDPATLLLTRAAQEANIGDRLLPITKDTVDTNFTPHPPAKPVEGRIISVLGGVSQIGQYNVVVLNRGAREGMEPGDVLAIYQAGHVIPDQVAGHGATVKLPDERAGELMIFRTYEKVSFALVMRATRNIHVLDLVRNP